MPKDRQADRERDEQKKAGKKLRVRGTVVEKLPNAMFHVELENKRRILAYVSGKMRMRYIRIMAGDEVTLEWSLDDPGKGRIVWLHK
jgi:translation initiation factor IF-1